MINLGIIFGGNSSEYEVALHSVTSLLNSIDKSKYNMTLIGISKEGQWLLFDGSVDEIDNGTWIDNTNNRKATLSLNPNDKGVYDLDNNTLIKLDVVFPVIHGKNGEDGTIQGALEMAQIPYVGCKVLSSSACMDKEYTHIICEDANIPMAKYLSYSILEKEEVLNSYDKVISQLELPIFIKPANAGSSYGVSKVNNIEEYVDAINYAYEFDNKILIEAALIGKEIGIAIMGNNNLIVGEVDEVDTKNQFFDFEGKYAHENTHIFCPARISDKLKQQAKDMGIKAYRAMNCSGMCRVDLFLCDEQLYLNELNTIPGFTSASRYPTMMEKIGINFTQLIDKLIEEELKG